MPYVVSAYAVNGSLRHRLTRQSAQTMLVEEALTILTQIGQALQHAHQQDIIHRDLKPENILFNAKGDALLADFGIAIVLATSSVRQVDATGTPAYMAPEQFRGMISKESDQYALGCIAYELFTGHQPFTAPDFVAMGFLHATEPPLAPTHYNPHLPVNIEQAILKALAKQRVDRHRTIADFITALRASIMEQAQVLGAPEEDIPTVLSTRIPTLAQTSSPGVSQRSKEQGMQEGNTLRGLKRSQEALAAYEQAIHLNPNFAPAYRNKGLALEALGKKQGAQQAYERARRLGL
jgi:serine/threonine protein kinase